MYKGFDNNKCFLKMSSNVLSKVKDLIFIYVRIVYISEFLFENVYILCVYCVYKNVWKCKWKWKGVIFFLKNGVFKGWCIFFIFENVLNIYGFISVVCDVVGWYVKML